MGVNHFFKFLRHDYFVLLSALTLLPTLTLNIFEKRWIEGNACHGTMISGSSTLELATDSDTAMNKLDESVSLTRMGRRESFLIFCQNLPLQSLWSKPLCQAGLQHLWLETWEHRLLCSVMEVMWSPSTCMPMNSMAVQILTGNMACVWHTVITDLKVVNVYCFLRRVTLSSWC